MVKIVVIIVIGIGRILTQKKNVKERKGRKQRMVYVVNI